jgi:hypothetical protein
MAFRGGRRLRASRGFSEFKGAPPELLAKARENLGVVGLQRCDRTLTTAEILTLHTAATRPILVEGVPDKTHVVIGNVLFRYTFSGAAFTGGGNPFLQFRPAWLSASANFTGTELGATSRDILCAPHPVTATPAILPTIGNALEVATGTAFAGGGGTLRVVFMYFTV